MTDDTYNLLDEPWIPVTLLDGSRGRGQRMSIRGVFEHARELRGIGGDIPLQQFAIARLLIAVLHGALPEGISQKDWRELWDHDVSDSICSYLEQFRGRFNLFDPQVPFYQVADLRQPKGDVSGLEKLILDVPNGFQFFTTRIGEGMDSLDFDQAARWLVTLQAFDPSGIKTGVVGDPRVKNGKGYPIGTAWAGTLGGVLIEGATLWQTLLLNFVGPDVNRGESTQWHDDKPIWERPQVGAGPAEGFNQEQDAVGGTQFFHGPATLYTWQSRRVRLIAQDGKVTGVIVANGDRLKPQNAHLFEPMSAWRESPNQEKTLKLPTVFMPRRHDPDRALWRGIAAFLPVKDTGGKKFESRSPLTSTWLDSLRNENLLGDDVVRLHAFGVVYGSNEAVVDTVVDDYLDLHLTVLASHDPVLASHLQDATQLAERGALALRHFAQDLAALEGRPSDGSGASASQQAYSVLDHEFRLWSAGIDDPATIAAKIDDWKRGLLLIFRGLGNELLAQASSKALAGRVDAQGQLRTAGQADLKYRATIAKLYRVQNETDASHKELAAAGAKREER